MKQQKHLLLILSIVCTLFFSSSAYAAGEVNVDNGGAGMGQGTKQNVWSPGNEGIRVTVIHAEEKNL